MSRNKKNEKHIDTTVTFKLKLPTLEDAKQKAVTKAKAKNASMSADEISAREAQVTQDHGELSKWHLAISNFQHGG